MNATPLTASMRTVSPNTNAVEESRNHSGNFTGSNSSSIPRPSQKTKTAPASMRATGSEAKLLEEPRMANLFSVDQETLTYCLEQPLVRFRRSPKLVERAWGQASFARQRGNDSPLLLGESSDQR